MFAQSSRRLRPRGLALRMPTAYDPRNLAEERPEAGLGCLIYIAVRAILGDGFDWMPWLPLGGGLMIVGAVCVWVGGR